MSDKRSTAGRADAYSHEDEDLLRQIVDDIRARPEAYQEGEASLTKRFSADAVRDAVMAEWNANQRDPLARKANRATAKAASKNESQRRRFRRNLSQPPGEAAWSPAARICRAVYEFAALKQARLYDRTAYAILLVAATDYDPDQKSSLLRTFGAYGTDELGRVQTLLKGTWPVAVAIRQIGGVPAWMSLVRQAWTKVGPRASVAPVPPERTNTAPQPAPLDKEALALAALVHHPDWTVEQIAKAAGCSRTTLYRMKTFKLAMAVRKSGRQDLPSGRKDDRTGNLEAWGD